MTCKHHIILYFSIHKHHKQCFISIQPYTPSYTLSMVVFRRNGRIRQLQQTTGPTAPENVLFCPFQRKFASPWCRVLVPKVCPIWWSQQGLCVNRGFPHQGEQGELDAAHFQGTGVCTDVGRGLRSATGSKSRLSFLSFQINLSPFLSLLHYPYKHLLD